MKKRSEETSNSKDRAPSPLNGVVGGIIFAEHKCGATKNYADQHDGNRNMERYHYRRKCAGKSRKKQNDDQDQPDMICLPNRRDGFHDGVALTLCPWAGGK